MKTTVAGSEQLVTLVNVCRGPRCARRPGRPALGVLVLATLALPLAPATADAQRLVLLVRHGERADGGAPPAGMTAPADPDLSAEGRARADRLAEMLAQAGITKIVVSEFRRTHQTAAPLASRLGLVPERASSKDVPALVKQLSMYTDDVVLVIGHNTTVPAVIAGLGGPKVVIPDTDYGNLFVYVPPTRTLTRLRY